MSVSIEQRYLCKVQTATLSCFRSDEKWWQSHFLMCWKLAAKFFRTSCPSGRKKNHKKMVSPLSEFYKLHPAMGFSYLTSVITNSTFLIVRVYLWSGQTSIIRALKVNRFVNLKRKFFFYFILYFLRGYIQKLISNKAWTISNNIISY